MLPESLFSPPWESCPHPERWHAHDGMATEVEVLELVAAFVRATQPDLVVETGTHRGFGAEAIGEALLRNEHGHLITLELNPVLVPPAPIDFAWFDSEPEIRTAEFEAFRPHMHARTVVGFHDTHPRHLYRPQLDDLGIQLLDLPTPRGVTFGRVR